MDTVGITVQRDGRGLQVRQLSKGLSSRVGATNLRQSESALLRDGETLFLAPPNRFGYRLQLESVDRSPSTSKKAKTSEMQDGEAKSVDYLNLMMANAAAGSGGDKADGKWESFDDQAVFVFSSSGLEHRAAIAAFDMDGTLIATKSGRVFAKDSSDWRLAHPVKIAQSLRRCHEAGKKIVIFSNQKGVETGKVQMAQLKAKVASIAHLLAVPLQAFMLVKSGTYRKPAPGAWDLLCQSTNGGVAVDVSASVFVGDAAGRVKGETSSGKADFSASDRLFALNVGVAFKTPDEFFFNRPPPKTRFHPSFNPVR